MTKSSTGRVAAKGGAAAGRAKAAGGVVGYLGQMTDDKGHVSIDRVALSFGMSKQQLAQTAGLKKQTLQKTNRLHAPKTQSRMREVLEIVSRVSAWAGGQTQAMAWYRAEPIPAFGHRTAESLVKDGRAGDVREYLDHIALGGFA
jgi:hypothetical protein